MSARIAPSQSGGIAGCIRAWGVYEDVNDADRPGVDPAMRWIVGWAVVTRQAASTSQKGRFETEALARKADVTARADLSGAWIDAVHARRPTNVVVLDMDSSVSPTHGEQEGAAYNGHFGCPALQRHIAHLLKRPVGRPPSHVRRRYTGFRYQAGSWSRKRRVVAKVEWHPGELYPRIGSIVTNLARGADRVVVFYNQRGTAEQYIKEGKKAAKWTRLSCRTVHGNAVRLQLHALAYNLANFLRTLALPQEVQHWSLTSIRDRLMKIGARLISHARYATFQMTEVAVPRDVFRHILANIADLQCCNVGHQPHADRKL